MNPRKRVSRVKSKRARERIYRLQIGGVRYDSHSPRPSSPQHWVKQRWISPIYAGITSKPVKTPRKFVRDVDLWNPRNRVLKIKSKSKESCMYIYINVGIRSILVDIWSTDEIERSNSISYNLTQQDFKPKNTVFKSQRDYKSFVWKKSGEEIVDNWQNRHGWVESSRESSRDREMRKVNSAAE